MAGTDFSHLTNDELIKGIKALDIPNYIRSKAYGIDVRETLAQLTEMLMQLAYNQGMNPQQAQEFVYKINNKIDKGNVTLNDLTQEVKEAMTGGSVAVVGKNSVLNENIVDGQVSPSKLSFSSEGINKFNGDYQKMALLTDGTLTDNSGALSVIIPIKGGQTYYIRKDTGNRNRLGWHKSTPKNGEKLDYYEVNLGPGLKVVEAPSDAQYMVFTVSFEEGSPNVRTQVTEGRDYPYFVGYDFIALENIKHLKSKLDVSYFNAKPFIDLKYDSTGWFEGAKIYDGVKLFIDRTRATLTNEGEYVNAPSRDQNPSGFYLAMVVDIETMEFRIERLDYQAPSFPEHFHLLALVHPYDRVFYGLINDEVTINGEPYIDDAVLKKIDEKTEITDLTSKYYFLEDLNGVYDKPNDIPDGSSGTELDLINSNHTIIYDIYDDLLAKYPDYVSKRVLGKDSNGLDINEYSFTAPRIGNEDNYHINVPKIIMISAIHGYEQASAYSTSMFFKDLAESWQDKEQLEFLRWNVDFVIIPVANPDGYDNNRRINYNGVDPNRNFWEGTITTGTPGDDYFGGFEGMAEPEVKAIAKMIDENLDADFYIDHHNIAGGYPMAYTYGDTDRTLMNSLYRTLSKKWAKDYPQAPQDGTMMGYISGPLYNNSGTYAAEQGIKSTLLETPWEMPFASAKYDKTTLEIGTEALGNLIVAICKSLK